MALLIGCASEALRTGGSGGDQAGGGGAGGINPDSGDATGSGGTTGSGGRSTTSDAPGSGGAGGVEGSDGGACPETPPDGRYHDGGWEPESCANADQSCNYSWSDICTCGPPAWPSSGADANGGLVWNCVVIFI